MRFFSPDFLSSLLFAWRGRLREHQNPGDYAAVFSTAGSWDRNLGYQRRNVSSNPPFKTRVRVCSNRWAPLSVHSIGWRFTIRLLTTCFTVDWTNAVEIRSPFRYRWPSFGMSSRLFWM